jgi:hypothetical protein
MPASIWLQLSGEADRVLRRTIAALASQHGTVPFQPHLTVCGIPPGDTAIANAAAHYVKRSGGLPLRVGKTGISYSITAPFRAVVIDLENSPELYSLRSGLRQITGAPEPEPPHISLLYTIGEHQNPVVWAADEARLRGVAQSCEAQIEATEFVLDKPIVVAPESEWTNIRSWKIVGNL